MTMWRRIVALLCITCQYQCAGSQRDHRDELDEYTEGLLTEMGISDGHTYERVAIEEWLATGSRTSPTTNEPLQSTALIPQFTVKRLVCAFMETRRSSVDEDVP